MFHMMNEARIGVGLAATMLGMAGYEASLDYAKNRPQGRPMGPGGKDAAQPQIRIIEHADVKRMLLAQKAYCEGALALELYCARLVDEQHTADAATADEARLLLEVLTPIAKSWPSEWCLEANSLAIQVHGGYGYTRDFPVEQYWRDNRLNMIHEGTHGIQGMDLLGRKVLMEEGRGLQLLAARMHATIAQAGLIAELAPHASALDEALRHIGTATRAAWATGNPTDALANAVPYLQAFGHTVLAWIWLDVALASRARCCRPCPPGPHRAAGRCTLLLPLRVAQDRRLAQGGRNPRPDLRGLPGGRVLMLKHIVMWKFKEHAEGADKATNLAKAKSLLEACADIAPGTVRFEVAIAQSGLECTYDLVLYTEFEDQEALDAYQHHPRHVALKPFIAAVRAERQCMDYLA